MLLGTYQPAFRAGCDLILRNSVYKAMAAMGSPAPMPMEEYGTCWDGPGAMSDEDIKYLGFDPVWCFPCRTPEEAFVQSCLSSPNASDLFFLIEADDYVRIDRIKWENCIRTGTSGPASLAGCATENLDDAMCDFLVPLGKLPDFKLACMPAASFGMVYEIREGLPLYSPGRERYIRIADVEKSVPGFAAGLEKAYGEISRIGKGTLSIPECVDYDMADAERMLAAKMIKNWFECSLLPALVSIALSGFKGADAAEFFRGVLGLDNMRTGLTALAAWAEGPRDYDGYRSVIDAVGRAWCGSRELLSLWINGKPWPGRNGACPCGSGKKFKKCCGQKYGLC